MRNKTTILLSLFAVICMVIIGCSSGSNSGLSGGNWVGLSGAAAPDNYATLTGVITDEIGQPVENVYVRMLSASMLVESAVTDSTGRYQIAVPAGNYSLSIQKSGYKAITEEYSLAANEVTVYSPSLIAIVTPKAPISANLIGAVLLNTTDELLPNISAKLFKDGIFQASSITTPEGKFIFQGYPAGIYEISLAENSASYNPATYVVHILDDGTLSPVAPKLYLSAKILGEDETIVYHTLATGTVFDVFTKAPLQYVTCTIKGFGSTVSDLNGYFEFRNLLPGTYELSLARDGWSTLVTNFTVRITSANPDKTEILPSPMEFYIAQSPEIDRGSISGRYVDETTGLGVNNLIVRLYACRLETREVTVGSGPRQISEWTLYSASPVPVVSTKTGPDNSGLNTDGTFRIEHIEPSSLTEQDPSRETAGYVVYVGSGFSGLAGVEWKPDVKSEYTWYLPGTSTDGGVSFKHKWINVKVKPDTTTYLHNYDLPYAP